MLRISLSKGQALSACQPTISGLFHSPSGVLFTFPSRYQFTIGRLWYLVLERGRPSFPQGFIVPHGTQDTARQSWVLNTGLSPSLVAQFRRFPLPSTDPAMQSCNPPPFGGVQTFPFSLAATQGISIDFFSWRYLDVSVHAVTNQTLIQSITELTSCLVDPDIIETGFPHSETAGSQVYGTYPTSIAAVCVLPRPKPPRHPLLALMSNIKNYLSRSNLSRRLANPD